MRTALVCVRTPVAAQSLASCAARLGVATLRTAASEAEALAQLGKRPAELILADTAVTRPDTVGFTRRVLALAPRAVLVLFGAEEPRVAAAAVAAGARGLIRGGDTDAVATVTKALLLIGSRATPAEPADGTDEYPVRAAATGPAAGRAGDRAAGGSPARPGGAGSPGAGSPGAGSPGAGSPGAGPSGAGPSGTAAPGAGSPGATPRAGAGAGGAGVAGTGAGAGSTGFGGAGGMAAAGSAGAGGTGAGGTGAGGTGAGGAGLVVPAQRGDPPGVAVPPEGRPVRHAALTERELQVLRGMAEGKSNAEIGRDLYVSEDTVKTHARRLFRKLKARDRAHAVAVGFRSGALG